MWEVIKKALVELFWPLVKDLVKKFSQELIEWLISTFRAWTAKRNVSKANDAEARAKKHEAAANNAESKCDAQTETALASVWREIAQMYKQDNEAMTLELEELRKQVVQKADQAASALTFDKAVEEQDGKLKLVNPQQFLPK